MNTTWRELLLKDMASNMGQCEYECTLSSDDLDIAFDDGVGCEEGAPFTAWSADYVYFPVVYDGHEWVGSVPRNPNGVSTWHQGR